MDERVKCLGRNGINTQCLYNSKCLLRTSQTNVARSCQRASSGNKAFAAVDAVKPIMATAAREYADVSVKMVFAGSAILTLLSGETCAMIAFKIATYNEVAGKG